ncbi:hypothetical protein [Streptomyces sp. NPDC088360]|uniref:hypothetical protein n=1 Tax=Streptomyces sp. NPDC088360 TaxID=3154515 RepID=UPI00344E370C
MKMIEPGGIPQFIGDFEQLDKDVSALRSDAIGIRNGGADVHSRFQMLGAYYTAPEADDLFSSTQPVMDRADTFAADLETVADALDTFSSEARPLAKRLETLEADARKFVASVEGDDDWHYDDEKTDRNNELMDDVAVTKTAFEAAERRAATKISAIVNGPKFIEDDGSHKATKKTVMYGYDADLLKQAKETPWGSHVSESVHAWEIHRHIKHYVWDGFIVGGGGAALEGLGHLVGIGGSAKDAWSGLADVFGGIGQYTMTPYDWVLDHTIGPDEESADEKRQKTAAREFAKSMVAWDQWEEHPVQAAGTATFSILTLGAGPLGMAAKGGKAGAASKAAGVAAKIGTYADPLSAGLTVGGKAFSKLPSVADLTARVRTGADATPELRRVHTDLEFDGSRVRVGDGRFTRLDAEGKPITETAPIEGSAAERANPGGTPSRREPALVGAGARTPGVSAHADGSMPPQASHDAPAGSGDGNAARGADGVSGSSGRSHQPVGGSSASHDHAGNATNTRTGGPHSPQNPGGGLGRDGRTGGDHGSGADGPGNPPRRQLTSDELKAIQDEHVRKANEDPAWRKNHYDSIGRRKPHIGLVDGAELPQLAKNAQGQWVAKHNLPNGPSETRFGSKPLPRKTAPKDVLSTLDTAAANREAYRNLMNTQKAYEKTPSASNREALAAAQDTYTRRLGDTPPNSKISETFGEKASQLHIVPHEFDIVEVIELPKTNNGANMFDGAYRLKDDQILIAEDKAPGNDLDWRNGRADPEDLKNPGVGDNGGAAGMRVKQGTVPYLRTIFAEMTKRGGRDAKLAKEFRHALKTGKLQYVLVKANEPLVKANDPNAISYAGGVLEHLRIYPERGVNGNPDSPPQLPRG